MKTSKQSAIEVVEAIREEAFKAIYAEIQKHIVHGALVGNGLDKTAERNGLVIASNLVSDFLANVQAQSGARCLNIPNAKVSGAGTASAGLPG